MDKKERRGTGSTLAPRTSAMYIRKQRPPFLPSRTSACCGIESPPQIGQPRAPLDTSANRALRRRGDDRKNHGVYAEARRFRVSGEDYLMGDGVGLDEMRAYRRWWQTSNTGRPILLKSVRLDCGGRVPPPRATRVWETDTDNSRTHIAKSGGLPWRGGAARVQSYAEKALHLQGPPRVGDSILLTRPTPHFPSPPRPSHARSAPKPSMKLIIAASLSAVLREVVATKRNRWRQVRFQNDGAAGPLLATICCPRLLSSPKFDSRAFPGLNALISDMLKLFASMALPSLAGGVLLDSYVCRSAPVRRLLLFTVRTYSRACS